MGRNKLSTETILLRLFNKVYSIDDGIINNPPKILFDADIDTKQDETGILKCVYRLWYGQVYIIWYGVTLWGSYYHFKKGFSKWHPELDHVQHKKIYEHMTANPDKRFKVEVLFESNNDYQLLRYHQFELDKAIIYQQDTACLNQNDQAYLPKYKSGGFGNFKRSAGAAFKRWVQSERYLRVSKELAGEYRQLLMPAPAMNGTDSESL